MRPLPALKIIGLVALLSSPALAQSNPTSGQHSLFAFASDRLTLDAAYSRVWMQNTTQKTAHPMYGTTGRLSWRLGQPALMEDAPLTDKLAIGVFWTKAPEQRLKAGRVGFSHYGAFAEYMPIGLTGLGFFEPNLSLSVGSFRPDIERAEMIATPLLNYDDSSPANLGIIPAVGTRIWFNRNLALRLDAHDLIVHSKKTLFNNPGFSAGLSARF